MRPTPFIAFTWMLLAAGAWSGAPDTGMERFFANDFLASDGPLAGAAQAPALRSPGPGSSTAPDLEQTCQRVESAALQGDAQAQLRLANCYANGIGVAKNMPLAMQWYQRAAQQGLPDAQRTLGILHLTGGYGPVDEERGVAWLRQAARQGEPLATALHDVYARKWEAHATDAVRICHQKGVTMLDDSSSASEAVVTTVQAACTAEMDGWIRAYFPEFSGHALHSLRVGAREAERSDVAAMVASLRTARQAVPGAQPIPVDDAAQLSTGR